MQRRIVRIAMTVATVLGILMLAALPMDVWMLSGPREERIVLVVLGLVVLSTMWAHVAIARRRPHGRVLAIGLGIYALAMVARRGAELARAPGWTDNSTTVGSAVVSGAMFAVLLIAAIVCLPIGTPHENEDPSPAV